MSPPQESDLRRFKIKTSGFSSNMYFINIRSYVHLHHINIHQPFNLCYNRIKKRREKKFFLFAFNNKKKKKS